MDKWTFSGDVLDYFGHLLGSFVSSTSAPSKARALSNLSFQAKKKFGLAPSDFVRLAGKLNGAYI